MMPQTPMGKKRCYEDLINDMNPLTKGINKIGRGIFGYPKDAQGNITPLGLAQMKAATQKTLDPDSMQSRIARSRQLDRERAERKLAEEQRMRAMIQSMLPPPAETVEPPEEFIPLPDPGPIIPEAPTSPVVESTRVPDFTIHLRCQLYTQHHHCCHRYIARIVKKLI